MSLFRQHISQREQVLNPFPILLILDDILEQARFSDEGIKVNLMSKVDNLLVTEGLLKGDITASVAKNTRLSQLGNICVISMAGVAAWRPISDFIGKTELKRSNLFI
ncbi:MAG: hypothetical protein ACLRWM_02680 [Streptococcus sp.]